MLELMPDVFSPDFTVYRDDYEDFFTYIDELNQHNLLPKYFTAPVFILWEITSKCPLNCLYCYNNSPKKVDELTTEQLLQIAEEIGKLKVFAVCLSGGEPSARPDFFTIAERLLDLKIPTSTITNGWNIDSDKAKNYAKYFQSVQVSLDGPNAEIHDKVRRREGSFDRAVRAIKLFKESGIDRISVSFAATVHNIDSFPSVVELCQDLGVSSLRTQPLVIIGRAGINHQEVPTKEQFEKLREYIRNTKKEGQKGCLELEWGDPVSHIRTGLRLGFSLSMRITAEGFLSLTPYAPYIMGHVLKGGIQQGWEKGLRTGWLHPRVKEEMSKISSIYDIQYLDDKALSYVHL